MAGAIRTGAAKQPENAGHAEETRRQEIILTKAIQPRPKRRGFLFSRRATWYTIFISLTCIEQTQK